MKKIILALAAIASTATALPAMAFDAVPTRPAISHSDSDQWNQSRRSRREEVVARNRVYRGRDGRTYCRRSDGTTGLVIGAVGGALLGRTIDTDGDRTVGTVLGGVAGALAGREIDRGTTRGSRCR